MSRKRIKAAVVIAGVAWCVFVMWGSYRQRAATDGEEHAVRMNEVCHNFSVFMNEDGTYRDYIELYNGLEDEVSLDGFYLSDSIGGINRYYFGDITIGAKDVTLVFLSKKKERGTNAVYADFKIKDGGTALYLFDGAEKLIDQVNVPQLKYDTSYGRDENGQWRYETPTPWTDNDSSQPVLAERMEAPVFSVESGFYESPFPLEITSAEKGDIYYTLDGSEPDRQSFLYEGPVLIEDASKNENVYAARTDLSAGFFAQDDRYEVPSEKVDKAVIVRAAVFSGDGTEKSATVTKSYFIGFGDKGYQPFHVISLVTDPVNLFDYDRGIYVSGRTFEQFVKSGERERMSNPDNWMRWKGNYTNRSREWERPVHIDYFDENRTLVMEEEAGIRIKGGATRSYTQKSLKLYARDIYSGRDSFEVPFFENAGICKVALFSGANDYKMKIRDVLIHNVCAGLDFSTMENRPCYVFLDGEYWGIYHLMEKYDGDYVEENYGVPSDDVIMVKAGYLSCGEEAGYEYFLDLMRMAEEADFSEPEQYAELCDQIDMQSFMDYYGTQIYAARCEDWPGLNEALWRSATVGDSAYQDGKWRWMIYDMNWGNGGLSESLVDMNSFEYVRKESKMFDNLMNNEQFRKEFVINFCDLTNTCLSKETLTEEFVRLREMMREPLVWDFRRFYGENRTEEDYRKETDDLYHFLQKRYEYITGYMPAGFNLQGTLETLRIEIKNAEGGYVIVNHVIPDMSGGRWSGNYFTDYPVKVCAVPEEGWKFAGWGGDAESQEPEIMIGIREGGTSLVAEFVK